MLHNEHPSVFLCLISEVTMFSKSEHKKIREIKMRKITQIKRSVKGISPVISVLLMIAIAVSVSLVAYAWVSGYMDFTTTKVGKSIQIQSISEGAAYVQNVGDSPVEISAVYVNGDLIEEDDYTISVDGAPTVELNTSKTATIQFANEYDPLPSLDENTYRVTVKVVTSDGISAEYTETFP